MLLDSKHLPGLAYALVLFLFDTVLETVLSYLKGDYFSILETILRKNEFIYVWTVSLVSSLYSLYRLPVSLLKRFCYSSWVNSRILLICSNSSVEKLAPKASGGLLNY